MRVGPFRRMGALLWHLRRHKEEMGNRITKKQKSKRTRWATEQKSPKWPASSAWTHATRLRNFVADDDNTASVFGAWPREDFISPHTRIALPNKRKRITLEQEQMFKKRYCSARAYWKIRQNASLCARFVTVFQPNPPLGARREKRTKLASQPFWELTIKKTYRLSCLAIFHDQYGSMWSLQRFTLKLVVEESLPKGYDKHNLRILISLETLRKRARFI